MANAKVKTEMRGTGGGRRTTREDAKRSSNKRRRADGKRAVRKAVRKGPMGDEKDTIHGHPVLLSTEFVKRKGYVPTRAVLVDKGDETVTALHCEGHVEWLWGHYFRPEHRTEAEADYEERAATLRLSEVGAPPR